MSKIHAIPEDMQNDLNDFNGWAEAAIASFIGPVELQQPPSIIYHYTDEAGLRGILESGQLWLTDIFSLNDPSELSHGFSIAASIIADRAKAGPPECELFAEEFATFLQGGIQASAHFFVGSFSSSGDDLNQWRAYAANGRGYALAFDGKALEDAFTKDGETPIATNSTYPIFYDDVRLIDLQRELIDRAFPLISRPRGRNLSSAVINRYMEELSISVTLHALRTGIFFKHEGYRSESEYRLLQIFPMGDAPPGVRVRTRAGKPLRYREFDWVARDPAALKYIVIGPAAERNSATDLVGTCLRSAQLRSVEIKYSEIPYRA
jgi:hypothetical protein